MEIKQLNGFHLDRLSAAPLKEDLKYETTPNIEVQVSTLKWECESNRS